MTIGEVGERVILYRIMNWRDILVFYLLFTSESSLLDVAITSPLPFSPCPPLSVNRSRPDLTPLGPNIDPVEKGRRSQAASSSLCFALSRANIAECGYDTHLFTLQ